MQETIIEAESINAAAKGSSSVASGALGDFALKNAEAMQKWQDDFCAMAGVYAFCLNSTGEPFTTFSGNPSEIEIIRKYVTETRVREIFRRVSESDLEYQAVELTEVPNLKLAAVAVKDGQRTSAVWIVCGIFSDYDYDKEYFQSLNLCRNTEYYKCNSRRCNSNTKISSITVDGKITYQCSCL